MVFYQFYVDQNGSEPHLVGILPERRKNRQRVTRNSILKWGTLAAGSYVDPNRVYYVQVESRNES
jgi:hypothetical protein